MVTVQVRCQGCWRVSCVRWVRVRVSARCEIMRVCLVVSASGYRLSYVCVYAMCMSGEVCQSVSATMYDDDLMMIVCVCAMMTVRCVRSATAMVRWVCDRCNDDDAIGWVMCDDRDDSLCVRCRCQG